MSRIARGKNAEDEACKILPRYGYKIVERNYRTRAGEIDIIARHKNDLVFIEVRARSRDDFGTGQETVNFRKQEKIKKTALAYIMEKDLKDVNFRFDVIGITLDNETGVPKELEIFQNAFSM
ncbi:MAG: YraN family protein [Chloroflexi bacterium]|nr:YraN family protein [Chloroflexota bacterium]